MGFLKKLFGKKDDDLYINEEHRGLSQSLDKLHGVGERIIDDLKGCRHKWVEVDWDITDVGDYYATYIDYYACSKCGAKKTKRVRAFL